MLNVFKMLGWRELAEALEHVALLLLAPRLLFHVCFCPSATGGKGLKDVAQTRPLMRIHAKK